MDLFGAHCLLGVCGCVWVCVGVCGCVWVEGEGRGRGGGGEGEAGGGGGGGGRSLLGGGDYLLRLVVACRSLIWDKGKEGLPFKDLLYPRYTCANMKPR